MLNLEELVFKVNTTELKTAVTAVDNLGKAVTRLNKPVQENETANAKLAKAQAQANEAAVKAEIAQTKLGKAQTDVAKSTKESVSVLQRQQDILGFMADGFSKGQSSTLAYAKATGAATGELEELMKVLDRQRALMGTDPFDKSLGAMKALKNEFTVLREANRLYNADLGLTKKQTEELAKEKLRLIERMKQNKASFTDVKNAVRELNIAYIGNASAENDLDGRMKARQKTTRDTAAANDYLAKEMDRVNRMLSAGSDITSTTNNRLIRFEEALKKSGKTAEQQAVALAKYKQQLLDIQKAGGNRQVDYLSRALGPQITDIFVGLSTGQAPLTVLLQQGGQLRDQFALAGVAGKDMAEMMKTAAKTMVTSIKDVALAVGSLVVGAFTDLGKAILNLPVEILKKSFESLVYAFGFVKSGMKDTDLLARSFTVLTSSLSSVIPYVALLSAAFAGLYALTAIEQAKLNKSLTLTGAALGLNTQEAIKFAKGMDELGVGTSKSMEILTEFAKEGVSATTDSLSKMIKIAKDLETYGGVAIKETAKSFVELAKNPTESLIKFAIENGRVELAVLKQVQALEKQGKFIEAVELAQRSYIAASKEAAASIKSNLSPLEQVWIDIKSGIKGAWDELKNSDTVAQEVIDALKPIALFATDIYYTFKKAGDAIGGALDVAATWKESGMMAAKGVNDDVLSRAKQLNAEYDAAVKKINDWGKVSSNVNEKTGAQLKANSDAARLYGEQLKKNKDNQGSGSLNLAPDNTLSNIEKQYADQLRLAKNFAKDDLAISKAKYDAGLLSSEEYYNETNGLIERGEAQQLNTIQEFSTKYAGAYSDRVKEIMDQYVKRRAELVSKNAGKDVLSKLLDDRNQKLKNLSNNFETWLEQLNSTEEALNSSDLARHWKAIADAKKAYESAGAAARKYAEDTAKINEETDKLNSDLDLRMELLGKTEKEQKAINREYALQNKLTKIQVDLERTLRDIRNNKDLQNDPMGAFIAEQEAILAAKNQRIAANKEVAVQAAEDFQAEFNKIRDGISDAIVTALFEGGQAGKKKLRDLLVAELKKPITLAINAVVSASMNQLFGNFMSSNGGMGARQSNGSISFGNGTGASGLWDAFSTSSVGQSLGLSSMQAVDSGEALIAVQSDLAKTISTSGGQILGYLGAVTSILKGDYGSGIGAAIGTYFGGPIGAAIGSAIGGALGLTDPSGTMHTGGVGSYSAAQGSQFAQSTSGLSGYSGSAFNLDAYSQTIAKGSADFAKTVVNALDSTAKTFGKEAGYWVAVGFADDTSDSGAWGQLVVKLGDKIIKDWGSAGGKWPGREFANGEAGATEYADAIAKDVRDVLIEQTPDWADAMLNALGDAPTIEELASVIDKINAIASAFVNMGKVLPQLAGLSDEATTHLMNLFGSIENLSTAASTYYQNFYSDAEKFTTSQRMLKDSFASLNIAMPPSIANFRQLVESQDLTTEAGRKMYASLLNIAPAFYEVANAIESAFAQISQSTADSIREIEMSIMTDAQKYDYLDAEIEGLLTKLSKAVDPTEIVGLYNKINSNIMEAYNLLPDTEKTRLNSQYVDRLGTAEAAAQSRLKLAGGATLEEEQAKAAKEQKETNEIIKQTAKDNLEAATIIRKAAEDMVEAANTAQTINIRLNDKASSQITF